MDFNGFWQPHHPPCTKKGKLRPFNPPPPRRTDLCCTVQRFTVQEADGGNGKPMAKLVRSLGKISCAAACCGMLRHAAACFSLHLWVPTLLCQVELTCKRQHAQHCWAKLITFTIRIVCSGFVALDPI